jgi:hypothetical protein
VVKDQEPADGQAAGRPPFDDVRQVAVAPQKPHVVRDAQGTQLQGWECVVGPDYRGSDRHVCTPPCRDGVGPEGGHAVKQRTAHSAQRTAHSAQRTCTWGHPTDTYVEVVSIVHGSGVPVGHSVTVHAQEAGLGHVMGDAAEAEDRHALTLLHHPHCDCAVHAEHLGKGRGRVHACGWLLDSWPA